MLILTAQEISKSYTERKLLHNISFSINQGDKIGIIGVNGTGKTTLLKIIAQEVEPDSGLMSMASGARIAYLPQNPLFEAGETVLSLACKGFNSGNTVSEYACKTFLTKLGITDFDAKIETLSKGQKKRVAMSCILASECDLLILDEPTNHMDDDAVAWLEEHLAKYRGALLMVTHDRYFLDRVSNKIIELDKGNLYSYEGNYAKFLELKAQRLEMEQGSERKRQSILRTELQWIQQGAKARGTKSRDRIERFEKLSAQDAPTTGAKVEMLQISSRLGKKILEIDAVSKAYDDTLLFADFSYNLLRDDRIGIVGPNGCGKSTLLKIISGSEQPDMGTIEIGSTVQLGVFAQESVEIDGNLRVIDFIKNIAPEITTNTEKLSATMMLERFLFDADMQYSLIHRLSGGELRRLHLLSVLMQSPNILLLDEPTNDLDIHTLSILEDYLEEFSGAVITVSHDRYFLDRVVEKIFAFSDGQIKSYNGGYSDYIQARRDNYKAVEIKAPEKATSVRTRPQKLKFTYKEEKEFACIDETIAHTEQAIADTDREILVQSSNFERLQELLSKKETLAKDLAYQMDRWMYLQDLQTKIEEQK